MTHGKEVVIPTPRAPIALLARPLVQATLPHRDPHVDVWRRHDGDARLVISAGRDLAGNSLGLPYGSIPRMLLYWLTTEAVRTQSRKLVLGDRMSQFLDKVGYNAETGRGKRGDATRIRAQMERLFEAQISFGEVIHEHGADGYRRVNMTVTTSSEIWWHRNPDQGGLFPSWIVLGEKFFSALIANPVPLDLETLRALKGSPLALDVYGWCSFNAFRARNSGQPQWLTWGKLAQALGAEYTRPRDFQRAVGQALRKIQQHYRGLKLELRDDRIVILPASATAVPMRETERQPKGVSLASVDG